MNRLRFAALLLAVLGGTALARAAGVPPLQHVATFDLRSQVMENRNEPLVARLDYSEKGRRLLVLTRSSQPSKRSSAFIYHLLLFDTATAAPETQIRLNDILAGGSRDVYAGFLDEEHYFAASENELLVFRIGATQPVARHAGDHGSHFANRSHIAHREHMLDWQSGKTFPVSAGTLGVSDLTADGWVLSGERNGYIARHHPVSGEYWEWDSGLRNPYPFVSASGRHVIAVGSRFDCRVWRVPSRAALGDCTQRDPGRTVLARYAAHPTLERFAAAWDDTIQVYELDPFQRIAEVKSDAPVQRLAFAGDTRLVVFTERAIQVWDMAQTRLIASASDADGSFMGIDKRPSVMELVNPNGRQVVAAHGAHQRLELRFYALPEQ